LRPDAPTRTEPVLRVGVNQLRTPNVAVIAAACGFGAIYINLEHNPTSLHTAAGVSASPRMSRTMPRAFLIATRRA
jgi:hypothetical protein